MSFLGLGGMRKPSSAEKIAAAETETKMMMDMHNRMSKVCQSKCIPVDYREGELNKGESVCLDRCVSKFFETHQKIAEIMQEQQQQAQSRNGGAGGYGFGG